MVQDLASDILLVAEPQNLGKSAKSSEIHKNIQNAAKFDRFLAKFAQKIPTKSAFFYHIFFGEVSPKNFRESPTKSAAFSANLSLKIPRNLTFFSHNLSEALPRAKEKWAISPASFQNCFSVPWLRYSAVWPNVIKYFLFSLWTAGFTMLIKKAKVLFLLNLYAPINVNPVGGSVGKWWGFDKFWNFWIKFPRVGNERSIKSVKKAPTPGEKI